VLYDADNPMLVANAIVEASDDADTEVQALQKFKGTEGIIEPLFISKHTKKSGVEVYEIITPLYNKNSLKSFLKNNAKTISIETKVKIALDILKGATALNRNGYVMCDNHCGNVFVAVENGTYKAVLGDLGGYADTFENALAKKPFGPSGRAAPPDLLRAYLDGTLNLETSVGDAKSTQSFEPESLVTGGAFPTWECSPPIASDSDSKSCAALASRTAVSRLNEQDLLSYHVYALGRIMYELAYETKLPWRIDYDEKYPLCKGIYKNKNDPGILTQIEALESEILANTECRLLDLLEKEKAGPLEFEERFECIVLHMVSPYSENRQTNEFWLKELEKLYRQIKFANLSQGPIR
jgi:hypothetical protein